MPTPAWRACAALLALAGLAGCPQPRPAGTLDGPLPTPAPVPAGDYMPLAEGTGWLWKVRNPGREQDLGQLGYAITKVTKAEGTTKAEGRRTAHVKDPETGLYTDLDDAITLTKAKAGLTIGYGEAGDQLWVPATMRFGATWSVGGSQAMPIDTKDVRTDAGSFKGVVRARAFQGDKAGYLYLAKDVGVVTWYQRKEPGIPFMVVLVLASHGKGAGTVVIPSPEPSASPEPSPSPTPSQ